MSVSIQAVLALLPEIFPGVQQIPLSRIRPNPENPGPPITEDQIADMAENITVRGLLNALKVMADKADPLAPGVMLHLDNPRLRGGGKPWEVGDFNWIILAGERRWRAFGRLQKEAIPASILNPTPGEAVEITHLDNEVRQRGWWADYQSIENRIKADPGLSQAQVATRLKMDGARVNKAIGLLPLLNPEARTLILENFKNSNKGKKGIFESAVQVLTVLGPDISFKRGVRKEGEGAQRLWPYPAIPPETQDLVRRVLAVAIDHQMTQAKVKSLVQWVKEGKPLEEFGQTKNQKPEIATSPNAPIGAAPRNDNSLGSTDTQAAPAQGASLKEAVMGASAWLKRQASGHHPTQVGHAPNWFFQALVPVLKSNLKRMARWAVILVLIWLGFKVGSRFLMARLAAALVSAKGVQAHFAVLPPGSVPTQGAPMGPAHLPPGPQPGTSSDAKAMGDRSAQGEVKKVSNLPAVNSSNSAGQNGNNGGIQYSAPVQVPVNGTTVTGIVASKGITVNGPKVLGVSLPGVSVANPLSGFDPFGGPSKPAATPGNNQ